jgi:phosphatidylinositol phospholipase C beta
LINPLSICANKSLRKLHTQLSLLTNEDKNLPSKALVKFFAQNKDDRRKIESALDSIGLPSGKGGEIPKGDFTFEKFQEFYKSALSDQPTEKVRNSPAVRPEVARVFKVFTSGERMESKEFLTFLNKEQRDPRLNEILHPYATEEKAISLIHKYEPDQYLVSKNQVGVLSSPGTYINIYLVSFSAVGGRLHVVPDVGR